MFPIPEKLRKDFFPIGVGGVFHGDALEVLKTLPDRIVQCCVTSPPLLAAQRLWGERADRIGGNA